MNKLLLFFTLFYLFLSTPVFSQNTSLPVRQKYSVGKQHTVLKDYLHANPFEISLGYSMTNFINTDFQENVTPQFGYHVNLKYNKLFPFLIEASYSNSMFDVKNAYFNYQTGDKISFTTVGGGLNLALLPSFRFFFPYVGGGYEKHFSSVGLNLLDDQSERIFSENAAAAYYKAGFILNFSPKVFIGAEYKQTLSNGKFNDYSQINASLGFRPSSVNGISGKSIKEDFKDKKVLISYAYHQTDFLNTAFKNNLKNGAITKQWGSAVNLRVLAAYPVLIDIGYFASSYRADDLAGWPNDSTKIRHRGGEIAVSMPVPISTYFLPYGGLGYQYSQLYVGEPFVKEEGKTYDHIVEMATSTSSPIYKIGVMSSFNILSFYAEYKHSFLGKNPFQQLSVGVGLRW